MSFSAGGLPQPLSAPATPMPASFRKSRRVKTTDSLMLARSRSVMADQAVHRRRPRGIVEVLAVAAHAPAHLERRILVDDLHLLDRTVALLTGEARLHVTFVVELHVVGQAIDLDPGDLLAALEVTRELLDLGPVRHRDLVAAHARAHRRQVGHRRLLRAVMTIETVHLELAGVERMTEM